MTLEAAPYPAPYGLPIAGLDFGEAMFRLEIAPGLIMAGGISTTLAHMIAEDSGDAIHWPFAVAGFVDEQRRSLTIAVHYGGIHDEADVSLGPVSLPLTRRMLRMFAECGLVAITMRVRPDDEGLQTALARLGFRACGRDDRPGDAARRIFTLDAATGLCKAFSRGLVPRSQVS